MPWCNGIRPSWELICTSFITTELNSAGILFRYLRKLLWNSNAGRPKGQRRRNWRAVVEKAREAEGLNRDAAATVFSSGRPEVRLIGLAPAYRLPARKILLRT